MTQTLDLYCASAQTNRDGKLLSFALVTLDGTWYYAEMVDYEESECDAYAQEKVLPRLMKIPRARFIKQEALVAELSAFIQGLPAYTGADQVCVRVLETGQGEKSAVDALRKVTAAMQKPFAIRSVNLGGREKFEAFHDHCGKDSGTRGHALVNALGATLCDPDRQTPSSLAEAPIRHLELLMGSKNAMSYRAWVRSQEAAWREAHEEGVGA